jgi:hypothetical protein
MTKLISIFITVIVTACATPTTPDAMRLCRGQSASAIDDDVLKKALVKAEQFSINKYGKDCVTCAELYAVKRDTFSIHITSPGDLMINTSASMEFDAATAAVISSGVSHSCYVKYKR